MSMSNHSLSPDAVIFFDGLRFFFALIVVIGHGLQLVAWSPRRTLITKRRNRGGSIIFLNC